MRFDHGFLFQSLFGLAYALQQRNLVRHPLQQVLEHDSEPAGNSEQYSKGHYAITEQNDKVCSNSGHEQWSGTVDVTDNKRLFFWYFESRNDPTNDPVILWMNGGPGGSSMMGLFTEMGPCFLTRDNLDTYPNPNSWNNNASVIFLEQPAGTGLSTLLPGTPYPNTHLEAATDFQTFLNTFFNDLFPNLAGLPLHIAGESFGGHYVPTFTHHILQAQKNNSAEAFTGNITSIILVNAISDITASSLGAYKLLCEEPSSGILNSSACASMAEFTPECRRLGSICQDTYDGEDCSVANDYCQGKIGKYYVEEQLAGRRSPYNIHKPCSNLPFCWDDAEGNHTVYIRQPRILNQLGFSSDFFYQTVNLDLNSAWVDSRDAIRPTTRELSFILDHSDVDVLVVNGNDDYIVNTPGQIDMYDRLNWHGLEPFKSTEWKDWNYEDTTGKLKKGGSCKGTRKLYFVGVDGAGHTAPGDQPAAVSSVVNDWIGA